MSDDPRIRALGASAQTIERARGAGEALRAAGDARVIAAIAAAASTIRDPLSALGRQAREDAAARSGLSAPNVERAIATSLETIEERSLEAALAAMRSAHTGAIAAPVGLVGMILAGNVLTAAIRPIAWALLARNAVVFKPSTGEPGLAELFAGALAAADPELGQALATLRFARSEVEMLGALASRCDVVHAWGSDRTITEIRSALSVRTTLVPHGHGLGVAYVPATRALDVDRIATAIAADVVLYDQRGCLSPHAVFVEGDGRALAHALERALREAEQAIPRGALSMEAAAAQMQWRGVAAARGELLEGSSWAVSHEAAHPMRISPGQRNVGVYDVSGCIELNARIAPLGAHLKALGVAGDEDTRSRIARSLPPPLCPRVSALGAMQTPPLLAATDGEPPWNGFVRRIDTA